MIVLIYHELFLDLSIPEDSRWLQSYPRRGPASEEELDTMRGVSITSVLDLRAY